MPGYALLSITPPNRCPPTNPLRWVLTFVGIVRALPHEANGRWKLPGIRLCVPESFDLGAGLFPRRALEKNVVRCLAVEWRIEVNEIDTIIADYSSEDSQVIAIIKALQRWISRK